MLKKKNGIKHSPKRMCIMLPIMAGAVVSLTSCGSIVETLNETASNLSDAASDISSAISDISNTAPHQESSVPSNSETSHSETSLPSEEAVASEEMNDMEETVTQSEETTLVGIRPEFKEAMDSYEAFYKEYVDFLKKYESSDNALGMLSEYMDYLSKYAEMSEKLGALNTNDLSDAETAYYTEVMARITKLLGELY